VLGSVLESVLLLCDPRDVGAVMGTCKALHAACADGDRWQPLVRTHVPHCTVVPRGVGSGAEWRRIWEWEANGVRYTELQCFFSKKTMDEDTQEKVR
jgi:hypothetical protein